MADQSGGKSQQINLSDPLGPTLQTQVTKDLSALFSQDPGFDISTREHPDDRNQRLEQDARDRNWERFKAKALFCIGIGFASVLFAIGLLLLALDAYTTNKAEPELKRAIYTLLTGLIGSFIGYSLKK
jgi:hypothetical protein